MKLGCLGALDLSGSADYIDKRNPITRVCCFRAELQCVLACLGLLQCVRFFGRRRLPVRGRFQQLLRYRVTAWDGGVAGQNATGVPDVVLTANVDHDGAATLQMTSSTNNASAEFKGIETVAAIPTNGILSLTLDVRTTAGNSQDRGRFGRVDEDVLHDTAWTEELRRRITDWGDWHSGTRYDEYRRWVMTIDGTGIAEIYDAGDTLRETWSFTGLTLADLGTTASVVLRQQLGGDFASPGTAAPTVWVDLHGQCP